LGDDLGILKGFPEASEMKETAAFALAMGANVRFEVRMVKEDRYRASPSAGGDRDKVVEKGGNLNGEWGIASPPTATSSEPEPGPKSPFTPPPLATVAEPARALFNEATIPRQPERCYPTSTSAAAPPPVAVAAVQQRSAFTEAAVFEPHVNNGSFRNNPREDSPVRAAEGFAKGDEVEGYLASWNGWYPGKVHEMTIKPDGSKEVRVRWHDGGEFSDLHPNYVKLVDVA